MARLTARVFSAHDFSFYHHSLEAHFVVVKRKRQINIWVLVFLPRQNTEGPRNEYKSFAPNVETEKEVTELQFLS